MRIFHDISEWRRERVAQVRRGSTLGFVPTMGALHAGHLSLVQRSRNENDVTLVSIFVNPTQFDDSADLERYPRTTDVDLAALRHVRTDYVLLPLREQIYIDRFRYRVRETHHSTELEGAHRPGHFDGMLTVVLKLLHIAAAEHAYFGEKDWQQLTLVRGMVEAFHLPTTIVACPTVREPSGLAMSSRNEHLSPEDRTRAAQLYRTLVAAASADEATTLLRAAGFEVDYVQDREGRRLAAVRLAGVRLIDNVRTEAVR